MGPFARPNPRLCADLYFKQTIACPCSSRISSPHKSAVCFSDAHSAGWRPRGLPQVYFPGDNMAINFPNRSRSYDATRRAVRFWGYDRSMESSFFIMEDALRQMQPDLQSDAIDILHAFDVNRERIYSIAAKVYARGRRGTYDLNAGDV